MVYFCSLDTRITDDTNELRDQPVHRMTISDIPNIIEAVCTESLITKTYAEILQFKGVNGLIENAKDLSEIFKPSFRGSNAREKEELIILNWTDYLFEAEGTYVFMYNFLNILNYVDLRQILAFATGASNVPPIGFPIPPSIRLIAGDNSRALPTASTCSLTLGLPLSLTKYNNFKE